MHALQPPLTDFPTERPAHRFPLAALLALAMTGFLCIVTETLPAGLLPHIGEGLGVSASWAGQLVTAYALGSVLAAIPLTIATRGWNRRAVLLTTITGFLLFNLVTAVSTNYALTLAARFMAGASAGLAWSLLAGYARRMVPVSQQGRAMAVAMVGTPVALSVGVPLGTWLGGWAGWRPAFGIMSSLALLLLGWVLARVPDFAGEAGRGRFGLARVLGTPGVRPVLGVVLTWMLAHNLLYTYVAPFMAAAGLGASVDLGLLAFGVAALGGIALTARLVDGHLRPAVLCSIGVFTATAVALAVGHRSAVIVLAGIVAWGLTFGGAATFLQTALADAAGEGSDVALSMNVVVWNAAIAGGGMVGGVLLGASGPASLPWVAAGLLLASFCIAFAARRHGFPAGTRRGSGAAGGH